MTEAVRRSARAFGIKATLSVLVLSGLFFAVGLQEVGNTLTSLEAIMILYVSPIVLAQVLVVNYRWWIISHGVGVTVSFRRLFEIQSTSTLLGAFLPTSLGISALRAWFIYREGVPLSKAVSSILIDRALLTAVLITMTVATQPILFLWSMDRWQGSFVSWLLPVVIGLVLIALCLVLVLSNPRLLNAWGAIRKIARDARIFLSQPRRLVLALTSAVVAQLLMFIVAFMIGRGLGIDLSLINYLIVMPSVALIASIPVSLGGWGIREGAMVAGFMLFGVPPEKSLLMGVIVGLVMLAGMLPGGALWLMERNRATLNAVRTAEIETRGG